MSRDESPRSRAALADATDHREREAADLRAYAHHRKPRARERLIRSYLPIANSIARRFDRGQRVPLEDLQQIAAIGLLKALDRYDPAHGAAFSTFAVPTMEGETLRYFRDFTWTVRPPRELQERAIRIEPERKQLTNDLGRNPTARELAAQVGCTPEELLDASEAAHARSSDSFARPATTQEGDAATLGERLGDEDPGFEAAEASARLDRLLNTLSQRDQLVLRLRFRDELTQTEIARRIGCSQMHVSRIQRAAPAQLVQNAATTPSEPNAPEHDAGYESSGQAAVAYGSDSGGLGGKPSGRESEADHGGGREAVAPWTIRVELLYRRRPHDGNQRSARHQHAA